MKKSSRQVDIFIIETSLASLFDDGFDTRDVINEMNEMGFTPIDITSIKRRPRDNFIHQIDFVFVRNDLEIAQGF